MMSRIRWWVNALSARRETSLPYEGTLFGTAEFVYRYVGARFLVAGRSGTTFVPQSIIHVPPALECEGQPAFHRA